MRVAAVSRSAELRENVTGYDAMYVVLAEALDAVVTCDAALGRGAGHRAHVEVIV